MFQARLGLAGGEVPVGALIIDGKGHILAAAQNRVERDNDATAHAEIIAIREAGATLGTSRLSGCILIATLEPCLMCGQACVLARLAGVVYGASDPACGAITSRFNYLDEPDWARRIWHMGGIQGQECAALLNDFFHQRRLDG